MLLQQWDVTCRSGVPACVQHPCCCQRSQHTFACPACLLHVRCLPPAPYYIGGTAFSRNPPMPKEVGVQRTRAHTHVAAAADAVAAAAAAATLAAAAVAARPSMAAHSNISSRRSCSSRHSR